MPLCVCSCMEGGEYGLNDNLEWEREGLTVHLTLPLMEKHNKGWYLTYILVL